MNSITSTICLFFSLLIVVPMLGVFANGDEVDVWIGTGGNEGVFHLTLNTETGKLSQPKTMNTLGSAGFLAISPDGKILYATAQLDKDGGVASYRISGRGKNRSLELTGFASSDDGKPACVSVDQDGKYLFSAQYGGGSTSSYRLDGDGSVTSLVSKIEHGAGSGVVDRRQNTAHPHWTGTTPDNKFLCVPDLGKDAVVVYSIDADSGAITQHSEVACPAGGGARHMKFHPSGKFAFVLNELTLTLSVFEFDASKTNFKSIQEIATLPEDHDGLKHSAAEVRVHPNGKFVYASNRGHDTIAVFQCDPETGKLTFLQREPIRGSRPRNFNLDPTGQWLIAAGQNSNTLALFAVDPETGKLTFTRNVVNVPNPICVEFGR
ncbi:MAG: lactonase family protein [Planctomycetota bacterium]